MLLLTNSCLILGLVNVDNGIVSYFDYHGVPLTRSYHSKERFDAFKTYNKFRPDDVVVCTYPKSGNNH